MDQNFYIPVAALNTESIEDFEKSIITTPFSTVKSSMAYINMQNIIGSQQYGGDYWNVTTINQLQYNFFVDNEFSGYYAEYNTSEEDIQSDKENAIFVKAVCNNGKWSFDNDSKNKIKKQKFNFSEDFLNQLPPVIKGSGVLYIGVPNGFGFNLLSLRKCESFIVEHNKAFSVI